MTEKVKWRHAAVLHVLENLDGLDSAMLPVMGPYYAIEIDQALDNATGNAVRRFSDTLFSPIRNDISYSYSQAILSILRKLNSVESVQFSSESIHPALMEELVQALRQMRELRRIDLWLTGNGLNFRDICLCAGSWPHLRRLELRDFEEGYVIIPACTCSSTHVSVFF